MITQEMAQAIRHDIDREVARLHLLREARRSHSEEAAVVPKPRMLWRWRVERGTEATFGALRMWLLAPYVKSASSPK